jgi:hypothetical protein
MSVAPVPNDPTAMELPTTAGVSGSPHTSGDEEERPSTVAMELDEGDEHTLSGPHPRLDQVGDFEAVASRPRAFAGAPLGTVGGLVLEEPASSDDTVQSSGAGSSRNAIILSNTGIPVWLNMV